MYLYERDLGAFIEWRNMANFQFGPYRQAPDFTLREQTLVHGDGGKIVCTAVTLAQARRSLRQLGYEVESGVDAEKYDSDPARVKDRQWLAAAASFVPDEQYLREAREWDEADLTDPIEDDWR